MKFVCDLEERNGVWTGQHSSPGVGPVRVSGASQAEVLRKLEAEIRYWLEMCPCTGEKYHNLQLELVRR